MFKARGHMEFLSQCALEVAQMALHYSAASCKLISNNRTMVLSLLYFVTLNVLHRPVLKLKVLGCVVPRDVFHVETSESNRWLRGQYAR